MPKKKQKPAGFGPHITFAENQSKRQGSTGNESLYNRLAKADEGAAQHCKGVGGAGAVRSMSQERGSGAAASRR
jgi:hypothetical protein